MKDKDRLVAVVVQKVHVVVRTHWRKLHRVGEAHSD